MRIARLARWDPNASVRDVRLPFWCRSSLIDSSRIAVETERRLLCNNARASRCAPLDAESRVGSSIDPAFIVLAEIEAATGRDSDIDNCDGTLH